MTGSILTDVKSAIFCIIPIRADPKLLISDGRISPWNKNRVIKT